MNQRREFPPLSSMKMICIKSWLALELERKDPKKLKRGARVTVGNLEITIVAVLRELKNCLDDLASKGR